MKLLMIEYNKGKEKEMKKKLKYDLSPHRLNRVTQET